eukprot:9358680-Heterocapsa_arctica.AAC.1
MTCVALKARCKNIGAKAGGSKSDLIGRLMRVAGPLNSCDRPKAEWRWGANGVSIYAHCKLCEAKVLTIDKDKR